MRRGRTGVVGCRVEGHWLFVDLFYVGLGNGGGGGGGFGVWGRERFGAVGG